MDNLVNKTSRNFRVLFGSNAALALFLSLLFGCHQEKAGPSAEAELVSYGFHGYVGYESKPDSSYGLGVSFYTAAWPLISQPLAGLQIGLPGTWIMPNNKDNQTVALCHPGTSIREYYTDGTFGPTYEKVFQTLEGGLGYWSRNKYRYGPPKFSMNSTPQCYDYEVASPGWSFFYDDQALPDSLLGVAQLSNRLLIPPDALTFEGDPNGEFMGYAYLALPFTDSYHNGKVSVGAQSWTCFINTQNFKGPIAYYLPETWTKMSEFYPEVEGRGLDAREGIINGGAMEINTVPSLRQYDADSTLYIKIPKLSFPVDQAGRAALVQDLRYYNQDALYQDLLAWRTEGTPTDGTFKLRGTYQPKMDSTFASLDIDGIAIEGLEAVFTPFVEENTFGFSWKEEASVTGSFPEYFKKVGDSIIPVDASQVPQELGLAEAQFPLQEKSGMYSSPSEGSWQSPGPASGPHQATLNDGSVVTYYWYRFIDQPAFGQFDWPEAKRSALQSLVEKIHAEWPINREYIPAPTFGELVSIDENLILEPPTGLEVGYVPVVVKQVAPIASGQ